MSKPEHLHEPACELTRVDVGELRLTRVDVGELKLVNARCVRDLPADPAQRLMSAWRAAKPARRASFLQFISPTRYFISALCAAGLQTADRIKPVARPEPEGL